MASTTTRRELLKKAKHRARRHPAGRSRKVRAHLAATLDARFTVPYDPKPTISYPSSWFLYTALIPGVIMPYDVVVANRKLGRLPDIQGKPDLRAAPTDVTFFLLWFWDPVPIAAVTATDISQATSLNGGRTMLFSDLGGGQTNWQGFRNFTGWYTATSGGTLYSIGVNVFVGPSAGTEWSEVQPIVNSVQVPA